MVAKERKYNVNVSTRTKQFRERDGKKDNAGRERDNHYNAAFGEQCVASSKKDRIKQANKQNDKKKGQRCKTIWGKTRRSVSKSKCHRHQKLASDIDK